MKEGTKVEEEVEGNKKGICDGGRPRAQKVRCAVKEGKGGSEAQRKEGNTE